MLTVLDLFSGIGGFSLGLERTGGFKTIGFCEIDPYCRAVLSKHWPGVHCHGDIETYPPRYKFADLICGGFPCQDVSVAGKRAGLDGDRSGLWSEFRRLICDIRPRYVIVENTPGLLSLGMGDVLGGLVELGYDSEWHCIPASSVGARHRRKRIWIIAYPHCKGSQKRFLWPAISDAARRHDDGENTALDTWGAAAPPLVRALHGIPRRVDRIRALGNAIVPQIAEMIGHAILNAEKETP